MPDDDQPGNHDVCHHSLKFGHIVCSSDTLIQRSFYLTDRLYRSVHPSPFALKCVVCCPQPDAFSTRPTRAGDHDDDDDDHEYDEDHVVDLDIGCGIALM